MNQEEAPVIPDAPEDVPLDMPEDMPPVTSEDAPTDEDYLAALGPCGK